MTAAKKKTPAPTKGKTKKPDLAKDAAASAHGAEEPEPLITDEFLMEILPKDLRAGFKKCKTDAARADFLYEFDKGVLKEARDRHNELDNFAKKLKQWFIQKYEGTATTGVSGKLARVEVKDKEVPSVTDWDAFYGHIKKKGEFELLNRAVNAKAVGERWEQGKEVPGVQKFNRKSVSLTKV